MTGAGDLKPLWHVSDGLSLFAGPLGRNARHSHSVPVFLAGLYEPFSLRIGAGDWHRCRGAVIPAGLAYEFDMRGAPLAVLYAEPGHLRLAHLHRFVGEAQAEHGALVGRTVEASLLREAYEDAHSSAWLTGALADLVRFAEKRTEPLDTRVRRVLGSLRHNYGSLDRVGHAADAIGLSSSRFQHVFTREVGVPFRRYRAWCRMRAAIAAALERDTLTDAAYMAGYSDQAHFSREFRRIFGAPAHRSLANARRA